jgi:hypothetical protein
MISPGIFYTTAAESHVPQPAMNGGHHQGNTLEWAPEKVR